MKLKPIKPIKATVYALCVLFLLWIAGSTTEVWYHNSHYDHSYSTCNAWQLLFGDNRTEMTVNRCQYYGDGYYLVTVCDSKGNLWGYYGDAMEIGTTVSVEFNHGHIVDVQ